MSLLLSSSRIKDLKVLYFLSITPRTSYSFIEEETGISTRTGKDIIKRINVAIEERFKISNYVVSNTKGEVYINSKYVIKKFEILYKLRLAWYKESLPLKLLNYLIENHQLSFIEVQNKLYISESGLKKIILKINNYLKSFSFKIISSKGLLKFDGDEIKIRLFLFNSIYRTYFNIEWPFSSDLLTKAQKIFPIEKFGILYNSHTRKSLSYIIFAILDFRFSNKCFIKEVPLKDVEGIANVLINFSQKSDSILSNESLFLKVPNKYKKNERLILELFLRAYIPETDSKEDQNKLGIYFSTLKNPITELSTSLLNTLDNEFNINNSPSYVRLYQLVLYISINKLLGKSLTPLLNLKFPQPIYSTNIQNKTMTKIKNIVEESGSHDKYFIDSVVNFIFRLYDFPIIPQIYLYLEFSKDLTASNYIKNRIYSIYNKEHIIFIINSDEADIIITDTFDIEKDPQKTFYLNNIHDQKGWMALIVFIQSALSKNLM